MIRDSHMGLILPRRSFLAGLASALAAPAIVKASSLMPVRALPLSLLQITDNWNVTYTLGFCDIAVGDILSVDGVWRTVGSVTRTTIELP